MTAPAMPAQILGRPVIETDWGITVYPARFEGDRWRATWYENGRRRQCEARTEERLAAMLKNVTERLVLDLREHRVPTSAEGLAA